ncbi:hypothetical protein N7931_10180 [Catenovulum sp. 2E275]|nr:hypothetical protein [Catenovulum sp. 2E275]MCU4676001.1 hypothetical protein [Catenovulum sp. 2E275]
MSSRSSVNNDPVKLFLKLVYWGLIGAIGCSVLYLGFQAYLLWFYNN